MAGSDAVLDWPELMRAALNRARGSEKRPVPGARLRPAVGELVAEQGLDLSAYLRQRGITFAQLVEREAGLTVIRRVGTDMLVAASPDEVSQDDLLPSARTSDTGQTVLRPDLIRPDLYDAITRFGTGLTAVYDPKEDRVAHLSTGDAIPDGYIHLPKASFDDEVDLRRQFAEQHSSQALSSALQAERPLTAFREVLDKQNLLYPWHQWKSRAIRDKLVAWAAEHHVEVRREWFGGSSPPRAAQSPTAGEVFKLVAEHMTDEEMRAISVPLRAVQAFLAQQRVPRG